MDEPVLKNLWDADVPASDPRFALGVMARIEQRRFRRALLHIMGLTAIAISLLWLIAPSLETNWRIFVPHLDNFGLMVVLAIATLLLWPQLVRSRS